MRAAKAKNTIELYLSRSPDQKKINRKSAEVRSPYQSTGITPHALSIDFLLPVILAIKHVMKILIDTNVFPAENIIAKLQKKGHEVLVAPATAHRELKGTDLKECLSKLNVGKETFLFGESTFPINFTNGTSKFEQILNIISTNSFPEKRDKLSKGEIRQLRDALIFESAVLEKCDIFCSNDGKAFFKHGKHNLLEDAFGICIVKSEDLLSTANA